MHTLVTLILLSIWGNSESVDTKFAQVYPEAKSGGRPTVSKGQRRAVILIHGLRPQLSCGAAGDQILNSQIASFLAGTQTDTPNGSFASAEFQDWQLPASPLVEHLKKNADVYCFAYGQNVPLERIAESSSLLQAVRDLKQAGYSEIVLMGHSAGGVLARNFVENHSNSGVTKVIQVCAPNGGTSLVKPNVFKFVPKGQVPFVKSLSVESMESYCKKRNKKIPDDVQFVCVVGTFGTFGDFVVPFACQWPEDLRDQRIPVLQWQVSHFSVIRERETVKKLSDLILQPFPRLTADQLQSLKVLFEQAKTTEKQAIEIVDGLAKKAKEEENMDAMLQCAHALLLLDSSFGKKQHPSSMYVDDAVQIVLRKKDKAVAQRFLETSGTLQIFLDHESQKNVAGVARGMPWERVIDGEVLAALTPLRKVGKDLFDPEIATRGADRAIALGLAKYTVLETFPTATDSELVSHKITRAPNSRARLQVEVAFSVGVKRNTATILFEVSLDGRVPSVDNIEFRDDCGTVLDRITVERMKTRLK